MLSRVAAWLETIFIFWKHFIDNRNLTGYVLFSWPTRRHTHTHTHTHTHAMETYQERFAAAYDYWIAQDAPPSAARDLAHDQLDFEDQQNEPETLGPNDSLPLHSY